MLRPPESMETPRLRLRRWREGDAGALKHALDLSLGHLHPWVPWAQTEPYSLDAVGARIRRRRTDWEDGSAFEYGMFGLAEDDLVGGVGLYARVGPGSLEIGYWVRADRVRSGFATEAGRALTAAAFALDGVSRVEMRIHPDNTASLAIPGKLGYTPVLDDAVIGPDAEGDAGRVLRFERFAVQAPFPRPALGDDERSDRPA